MDSQDKKIIEKINQNDAKIDSKTYMGALEPYFELVQNEYNHERNKKQSFEARSGIILSVIAAIIAIVFDRIKIADIFPSLTTPLTFMTFIQIVSGFGIYVSLAISIYFSLKTIFTKKYATYDVSTITSDVLGNNKNIEMGKIIITYCKIINEHRILNEEKAKSLSRSVVFLALCTIFICVYTNI